ncbi:MAG: hypothetical protein ACK40I_05970 [Tabrizicola sp.]
METGTFNVTLGKADDLRRRPNENACVEAADSSMRAFIFWLAAMLLAGPAVAQGSGKLTPLPTGPPLLDWVRSTLTEALDGVTQIVPGRSSNHLSARTSSPALPAFTITVLEQVPAVDLDSLPNSFVSTFRAACGPLRPRGELDENLLNFIVYTLECPTIGASGLHLWVLSYRDTDRTQLIALSSNAASAAAINTRGDKLAAALGLRLYPTPRSLAEAMAVGHALGLSEYNQTQFSSSEAGRGRLRVAQLIEAAPGTSGNVDVHVRSCSSIQIREIEDGPPTRVSAELVIDLQRFAELVTREGPNLNVRPGTAWQVTRFPSDGRPLSYPMPNVTGLLAPDANWHAMLDSYLLAWERFCAPSALAIATPPAGSAAQPAPSAPAFPPQAAQTGPGQSGAAPGRACEPEGALRRIARGRASGDIDEPARDAGGPYLMVNAAWWRSIDQSSREGIADIVH